MSAQTAVSIHQLPAQTKYMYERPLTLADSMRGRDCYCALLTGAVLAELFFSDICCRHGPKVRGGRARLHWGNEGNTTAAFGCRCCRWGRIKGPFFICSWKTNEEELWLLLLWWWWWGVKRRATGS